jgi:uncharacterized surface protein with fasciclin (FAS1) repeats
MRKSFFVVLTILLVLSIAPALAQDASTYDGDFNFEVPEGYEVTESGTLDLVRVEGEGNVIIVAGPDSYAQVLGGETFESDADALNFYLDRSGYTVGDPVEADALAAANVALERRDQEGTAYLLDMGFDRVVVVITLTTEGSEVDEAASETVLSSIEYPGNVVDVLSTREDLSVLLAAVEAAGLGDALNSGEFTIFAPNNQAFVNLLALLGTSQDALLANTDVLTTVLQYHVVEGAFFAEDVVGLDGEGVDTLLEGNQIGIDLVGETVVLNNVVEVIEVDIEAGDSVVHVINDVLLPQAVIDAVSAAAEEAEESGD